MEILKQIDPEEMEKIKQLEDRARKLHLPMQGFCSFKIEVLEKNGELKTYYETISKSFVRNAYNFILYRVTRTALGTGDLEGYEEGKLGFKSTTGTMSGVYYFYHQGFDESAGINDGGCAVGTSDAAEDFDGYILGAVIEHGEGAGQMLYNVVTSEVSWVSESKRFKCAVVRNILNNSGGAITVKEVGLLSRGYDYGSSVGHSLLHARDVLSPAVVVDNEEQIRVTYNVYGPVYP